MLYYTKLYLQIITKELHRYFTYRTNLYSGAAYAALNLAMRYALWSALFMTGNAQGTTFQETMTFFIISSAMLNAWGTRTSDIIGADIRTGDIAQRLTKPYPYQFTLVTLTHAFSLQHLITAGLPMLLIGFFAIGIAPPASVGTLLTFLVSAFLGSTIYLLVDLCISYSAFYLTDYWFISWFTGALFALFGGMTLPLWFYPEWLLQLSNVLPFRYAVYQPMAIYLGRAPASGIWVQCAWILCLFALERLIWSRTLRKVVVQGG